MLKRRHCVCVCVLAYSGRISHCLVGVCVLAVEDCDAPIPYRMTKEKEEEEVKEEPKS